MQMVKDRIKEETGYDLHEEVLYIPWEGTSCAAPLQLNTSLFPYKGTTEAEECGAYDDESHTNGKHR